MALLKFLGEGDSNTQYTPSWVTKIKDLLASAYGSNTYSPINVGGSGESSREVLANLSSQILSNNPHFVAIMIGTNDVYRDVVGYNGYPTDDYTPVGFESRMRDILTQLIVYDNGTTINNGKILPIVISTPPSAEASDVNGSTILYSRDNTKLVALNQVLNDLAVEFELPFIDVYTLCTKNQWLTSYTIDGVHANETFRQMIANLIKTTLQNGGYLNANGEPVYEYSIIPVIPSSQIPPLYVKGTGNKMEAVNISADGELMLYSGGTIKAFKLVEITDPNASALFIKTSDRIMRIKK